MRGAIVGSGRVGAVIPDSCPGRRSRRFLPPGPCEPIDVLSRVRHLGESGAGAGGGVIAVVPVALSLGERKVADRIGEGCGLCKRAAKRGRVVLVNRAWTDVEA